MAIPDHIERHLGTIGRGWKESGDGAPMVVVIENKPEDGVKTYCSIGLSSELLELPSGKEVRQEFLLGDKDGLGEKASVSLLLWMCEAVRRTRRAVGRGQVIRMPSSVARTTTFEALYCAIPVVYEEGLATCTATQPATVFVWLIPIHADEAEFVERSGWSEFEDLLESRSPDLFDPARRSVV